MEQRAMSQTASYSCSSSRVEGGRCIVTFSRLQRRRHRGSASNLPTGLREYDFLGIPLTENAGGLSDARHTGLNTRERRLFKNATGGSGSTAAPNGRY